VKAGRSLVELAQEITRQQDSKADYIVQSQALTMTSHPADQQWAQALGGSQLAIGDVARAWATDHTHSQLAQHLGIPATYYNRIRAEQPGLLDVNVNTLLRSRPTSERRMVRTLDNRARAFLSDKYRRLDNYDLLEVVLPELQSVEGLRLESCEVTDRRLYLKAVTNRVQGEVSLGQVVQAGVLITNSEIGMGTLAVQPMSFVLACLNGAVHDQYGQRRNHVGKAWANSDEEAERIFADDTLKAQDKAFYLTVRDTVRGALSEALFGKILDDMREAAGVKLEGDPVKAVEVLAKKQGLNEAERGGVLRHLIEGGSLTLWGMANAITRAAQDVESYDRSTELEMLGGQIITLPKSEWREIAAVK